MYSGLTTVRKVLGGNGLIQTDDVRLLNAPPVKSGVYNPVRDDNTIQDEAYALHVFTVGA